MSEEKEDVHGCMPRARRPFFFYSIHSSEPLNPQPSQAQASADAALAALRADTATPPPPRHRRAVYAFAWGAARDLARAAVNLPPGGPDRRACIQGARAGARVLARAAGGAFDASGREHSPASLTLAVSALTWAGLADDAAALVRQACADATGASTGLPRPLGAGALERRARPFPPPTGALASAASGLARSGRAEEAAALIQGGLAAGAAMDEGGWARVVRFGGRAPGGVGARPARDLLAAAVAAGITPGQPCHSALVRAELDAGSLPNALAAADEAAAAGVDLSAWAWESLAARAAAHFGPPGKAAVDARAGAVAVDARAPPPPAWVDLAAAAASLPPGRVPASGLVGGAVRREMAYASSGDD